MVSRSRLPERKVKQREEGHQCQVLRTMDTCRGTQGVPWPERLYFTTYDWNPMPVLLKSVPYKDKV